MTTSAAAGPPAAGRSPAAARWRDQLASWAIPQHILDAVDESPWQLPAAALVRRTDMRIASPSGVSLARTAEALDPPGGVLDVGAGFGAASLPLAPRITELVALDENAAMLEALSLRARSLDLPVHTVLGRWPDIADDVSEVDVVVCHHVCYNVPDLAEFALALHAHARRRVVVELTATHPHHVYHPFWLALHGVTRPSGPTADDAVAVFREAGLAPRVQTWTRPGTPSGGFEEYVETARRAVCLPAARRDELVALMRELGVDPAAPIHPARDVVTLWWDVADDQR